MDLAVILDLPEPEKVLRLTELFAHVHSSADHPSVVARVGTLPGWRFTCGEGFFFGPVACEEDGEGRARACVGSLALDEAAPGSTFDAGALQRAWSRWTRPEQEVYEEARELALALVAPEIRGELRVRLHVMRWAVWQVQRFRAWLDGIGEERRRDAQASR